MATLNMEVSPDTHRKIFEEVIDLINNYPGSWAELAEDTDVSQGTMRRWVEGKTYHPQLNTVIRVLEGMGYTLEVVEVQTTVTLKAA